MKKTWTLILSVCLAVCVLCSGFALTACDSERKKLDLTISNYAEYDGLMAGVPSDSYVSPAAKTVFRAEAYKEKKKMPKLYGRRKDGSYEQIEFEEENDITTKYGLYSMQKVGDFVLMSYSKNYTGEVYKIFQDSGYYNFLMDTRSGKLFDISELGISAAHYGCFSFSEGAIFVGLTEEIAPFEYKEYLCKFSVVGGMLEVKKIMERNDGGDVFSFYTADKYGNLYSLRSNQQNYIYTKYGVLEKLDHNIFIAANGIAYQVEWSEDDSDYKFTKWINSYGETENAEFVPESLYNILDSNGIIFTRCFDEKGKLRTVNEYSYGYMITGDNRPYLYSEENVFYCFQSGQIVKYEFIDDVRYEVEFIDLEKCESYNGGDNTVYAGERVYFLNSEEVYYINMKDGSAHTLSSGYIFKKIYSDNQGGIIFEGLDERLNTVTGMIGADDSVTVGITPREYEIFYIASLN